MSELSILKECRACGSTDMELDIFNQIPPGCPVQDGRLKVNDVQARIFGTCRDCGEVTAEAVDPLAALQEALDEIR